jgi:hypothetical protein
MARRFSVPQIGDRVRVFSFSDAVSGLGTVAYSSRNLTKTRGQFDVLWCVRLDSHCRVVGFHRSMIRIVYRKRQPAK